LVCELGEKMPPSNDILDLAGLLTCDVAAAFPDASDAGTGPVADAGGRFHPAGITGCSHGAFPVDVFCASTMFVEVVGD